MLLTMDYIRPFFSGIIGAILAFVLARIFCRFFPDFHSGEGLEQIQREFGKKIRIANILSVLGFCTGLSLYFLNWLPRNDWRGFGLALGLTAAFPLLYLFIFSDRKGIRSGVSALNAFSRIQRTPRILMYTILLSFLFVGLFSLLSLI